MHYRVDRFSQGNTFRGTFAIAQEFKLERRLLLRSPEKAPREISGISGSSRSLHMRSGLVHPQFRTAWRPA